MIVFKSEFTWFPYLLTIELILLTFISVYIFLFFKVRHQTIPHLRTSQNTICIIIYFSRKLSSLYFYFYFYLYLRKYLRLREQSVFLGILRCSERCSEVFWAEVSEVFWGVLRCSEVFWGVLGCSEVFWGVLSCS